MPFIFDSGGGCLKTENYLASFSENCEMLSLSAIRYFGEGKDSIGREWVVMVNALITLSNKPYESLCACVF